MRVLHVIPSVSGVHGGPSQALAVMEQGLCASGASVTTATTDDDGPGRRLKIDARPAEAHGARRVYCRKWLDFYKVARPCCLGCGVMCVPLTWYTSTPCSRSQALQQA